MMVEKVQGASNAWNERMRLIRLRRKKERPRFLQELRIVPKWLIWMLFSLWVLAQVLGLLINLSGAVNNGRLFPNELSDHPVVASLALGGIITGVAIAISTLLLMLGY